MLILTRMLCSTISTPRYLWSQRILHSRMLHLTYWNCRCPRSERCENHHCWNDPERSWSWESTACVRTNLVFIKTIANERYSLAAMAEIVPRKHRGTAQAVLDLVLLPWAIFGPLIGNSMVRFSHLTFRINFIIGIILNLISITAIKFWYHPVSACSFL